MSDIYIHRTSPLQQLNEYESKVGNKSAAGQFSQVLQKALEETDGLQKASTEQIEKVLSGDVKDVHSAMLAMQKADLSFQTMMQVRNKLIDAYHEIMRMQV